MKNLMINRIFKYYVLLFGVMFSTEILFRAVSENPVFDWTLLRIFMGCSILALFLSILLSFCKDIVAKIITGVVSFAVCFYATLQAGFLNFLGVYISMGTSDQLGAVKDYIADYLGSFKYSYIMLFIPFAILILYYILVDRNLRKTVDKEKEKSKEQKVDNWIWRACAFVLIIILSIFYYMSLNAKFMQNSLQLRSTKSLFSNPSIPNIAVNQFGITTYAILDIKTTIFPVIEGEDGEESFENENENTKVTDMTRHIDDYSWEQLIKNTRDSNLNKLNNYYITRKITDKNEHTGIFEGKNLIMVMLESVNTLAIDKDKYPTFWKLYNEGWAWENAYSPRNACSTGNNEMSGAISLFTINNSCTANRYRSNTYFQSIYNLFNDQGYKTSSYHNYNDTYYYRKTIHPNWGSGKYYDMYDLGIKNSGVYSDWPSDVELMQKAVPKFINEDKFFSFIITVSAHHPYSNYSKVGDTYAKDFSELPTAGLKRYHSKMKYTDLALKNMMEQLEKADKLKDTVIVLYSDHYPYGFKTTELQKAFDYDLNDRKEIDRTPFIIYNPELTPKVFDEYTTFMNITPTLANLFNLDYDPRLYAGEDILSSDYSNMAIFADGSWQSDIAYYEATTGRIKYMGDEKYTNEEIVDINKTISNKIKMSNLAIQKNYFSYLDKNLKKFPKPVESGSTPASEE